MRILVIVGLAAAAVLGVSFWASQQSAGDSDEIVVYSARQEHLIKPLFDRFTEQTGIRVRYITDDAGPLLQRLRAEGSNTRADMLMTVDAGNLWQAAEQDVLAAVASDTLERNVPAHLRDPDGRWFGLSVRARTIVYSPERVDPEDLSTYEALADEEWDGRLCLRTSKKVYNQSLVATMIARHGEQRTEEIVGGWVDNLATQPFSNDTAVMEAIVAGQCDVGIVNTYYFGRLQERDGDDTPLALFWPNQDAEGVHVNVSGAGITRHASNPEAARQLLEWLSEQEAQELFGALNMEYPVRPDTEWTERVRSWGEFQGDDIDVAEAGRRQVDAVMLMDRVGYR